ncbi:MAG: 30S ribosomal protein S16 [Patescibacteria group bacterium]|nr:30S ribosomal protein S16 [Patescibacteria group bacterium]
MSVKIRLSRYGKKNKPFYRIVVCDEAKKRDGKVTEIVGTYNPMVNPSQVEFKKDRVEYWLSRGAKFTDTVGHLYKK